MSGLEGANQKREKKKTRGRPRKFEEALVLEAAGRVFWEKGFSGASLDDLASAMKINRPSMYSAFGDKQAIYLKSLAGFTDNMSMALDTTLFAEPDIKQAMLGFYLAALDVYTQGDKALGCMVVSTAVCSAPCHPEVQSDLFTTLQTIDHAFEARFSQAVDAGHLLPGYDVRGRARIAQGILHSISVRARAGESKLALKELIDTSVDLILGEPS